MNAIYDKIEKDGLSIYRQRDFMQDEIQKLSSMMDRFLEGRRPCQEPPDYLAQETHRLIRMSEDIMHDGNARIFSLLPLTTKGLFPMNRPILLMEAKIHGLDKAGRPNDTTLQLRLIQHYGNNRENETKSRFLVMGFYPGTNEEPIFS